MMNHQVLAQLLLHLDGRSYKAYQEIRGRYQFPDFELFVDHVQGDPFAAPSRLRVLLPQTVAAFPAQTYQTRSREIALRDYLTRQFGQAAASVCESRDSDNRGSGHSGLIAIAPTGQQVLERTAVFVTSEQVEARFVVGLPARGRQILGRAAATLLCDDLPQIVEQALKYISLDATDLQRHLEMVEDADWLRQQLPATGLVAFIPNGAVLPRHSGISDQPLAIAFDGSAKPHPEILTELQTETSPIVAIPFQSPATLQIEFDRPNQGSIQGMGIPTGITLIVGGGYHGKSTLLRAIALGIYNHIPGDGREQVVSHPTATKIRAEDGRSVTGVDISPFISHLPQGRSTKHFSTENASGSTSQASNVMEALEAGATVLLIDEDTSATNFMIRDRRMQALIAKAKEPITPLIDKIQQLYQDCGVSTVLVMGGSGDYFDVAHTIIAMTDYRPQAVTAQAKAIAAQYATARIPEGGTQFGTLTPRVPVALSLSSQGATAKLKVRAINELILGTEIVDLAAIEQLVEAGQVRAIGAAIAYLERHYLNGITPLSAILTHIESDIATAGIDILTPYPQGDLVRFRALELAAAFNRLRSLSVKKPVTSSNVKPTSTRR